MRKANITKVDSVQELLEWEMQFIQEEIDWLAEDVVDLEEKQDVHLNLLHRLSEWCVDTVKIVREVYDELGEKIDNNEKELDNLIEHYNNTLENDNHNFSIVENKINNLVDEVSNLDYHRICLWVIVVANVLVTFLMLIDVL